MNVPKTLLMFDNNQEYNEHIYESLKSRGAILEELSRLEELASKNLTEFAGFIVHTGMQSQLELFKEIIKYPSLKVAIITRGPGEYQITQENIAIFPPKNPDVIYDYFFNK